MSKEQSFRVRRMLYNILVGRTIKAVGFNKDNQIEYIKLDGEDGKLELHLDLGQHHIHDFRGSAPTAKKEVET